MISKQLLLGLSLILGGGVILYAVNQGQNNTVKDVQAIKTAPQTIDTAANHDDGVARPTVEPLTVDMATEDKLLSVKQQVREARTLAQERQAMALIEAQEKAQQLALDKASAEQKALATPADALTVEIRPEAIAVAQAQAEQERLEKLAKEKELKAKQEQQKRKKDEKAKADKLKAQKEQEEKKVQQEEKTKTEKQKKEPAKKAYDETPQKTNNGQHKVVRGDGLIKLSRQYGVPVSALAQANNMGRDDPLPLGKTIKIPSKTQVARLERDAKERKAQKIATERVEKRLKEARQRGSDGNGNGNARYGVQVSLANNQTKADELAKKYRDAGYTVSTSQTSRGVRVLVGSEKNQDAAAALRDKIKNDSRVDGSGAWVKRVQ